ncbi:MAG: hypothetical protein A3K19_07535 [Lentisphaerae bacterium RIFOXYB12_FULL_65_16]|nr:MAG: hypothetical protein A3K18_21740 [Lentisphaerae bacterium RIFOXYA12_64_32]OGV93392.1 MAG: hypothetical protein A3K19_07535 [Lentisphaerae bacterium RIFOXYB12_FULL_65_16]
MTKQANPLSIGWASRDVSTDQPVGIRGQFHLRLSEGVLDPVTVTALAIGDGHDAVIFLSCDCVVIWSHVVKAVREKVRALAPKVPVEKIILNATHTHEGGDLYEIPDAFATPARMPGKEYQAFFVAQAADAVIEAWNGRTPGGVAWGYGFASVAHSRRAVYLDDTSKRPAAAANPGLMVNGHAVMYGKTNDPMFSHFEAGTDAFLNVLFTFDSQDELTGVLVNVPCPSQVDEGIWKLSADYWHETRVQLRKRFGEKLHVLPQCAAGGDLSPHYIFYKEALKRRLALKGVTERQDIAERVAAGVAEVFSWAKADIRREAALAHVARTVELTRRPITREECDAERRNLTALKQQQPSPDPDPVKRMINDSRLDSQRRRCQGVIDRYEAAEAKLPMELHVVRLGDVAFASNRFELYMDFMHRIQARSPAVQTFVIQLAGSEVGERGGSYLPTVRGEWGKGYSATVYCNLVNSTGGQELVEETLRSLNEIFPERAAKPGGK